MTDDNCNNINTDGINDEYGNNDNDDIEIDFKLDSNGRIALLLSSNDTSSITKEENTSQLCYDTHVVETKLRFLCLSDKTEITKQIDNNNTDKRIGLDNNDNNNNNNNIEFEQLIWDELYYDCEICDNGLMPRTFWIGCNDNPRCSLEQIAYDIFQYHTKKLEPNDTYYDTSKSGVEWWIQIRPSPDKVGRYNMHSTSTNNNDNNSSTTEIDMTKDGISFHWDKDEELRLLCDGTTYVHPQLSTVTYLTSVGSPTLIINKRIHNLTGEWIDNDDNTTNTTNTIDQSLPTTTETFVTYPYRGKHLSFDGRYLHSAPYDLLYNGNDVIDVDVALDSVKSKREVRSNRRITFLVNIWLNYIPMKTKRFPDSMIDKLSGYTESCNIHDDNEQFKKTNDMTKVVEKEIIGLIKNQRVGLSFQENVQLNSTSTTVVSNTSIEEKASSSKRRRVNEGGCCTIVHPYHVQLVDIDCSQIDVSNNNVQHNSIKNDSNKIEQFITTSSPMQTFNWPMGDCTSNEYVHADIPILPLEQVSSVQGNIRIRYNNNNNIIPTQKAKHQEESSSSDVANATLLIESDKNVGFINSNHMEQPNNRFGMFLYRR